MVGNILIAVAIMVALVELQLKLATNRIILLDAALFADKPADENSEHVSEQRTAFSSELRCHESPTHNMTIRSEWFVPPVAAIAANGAYAAPVQPCTYSFLDIGVGRGESLGWFIDAGIPMCPTGVVGNGSKTAHYDVEQGFVTMHFSPVPPSQPVELNDVTAWAHTVMMRAGKQTKDRTLQPEEYCYYGVEESPMYTGVLNELSTIVLQSRPRPLRQVHFYTGTPVVGAIDDSSKRNKLKPRSSSSGPITLSSLLEKTVRPQAGNHVMVRVHGDNAFSIVNNAYDDGTLCGLAEKAVRLDILIQATHSSSKDGDYERFRDIVKVDLLFCGVHVRAEAGVL